MITRLRNITLIVLTIICSQDTILAQKKPVIYQLLPRLFGNKQANNITYGTIEQNGSGKFNDISLKALDGIKELGVTYVWYTGIIAHASLTDYSAFGIKPDDADVVKGRAGSPYAIRDYYDVDPDLAVDVSRRMDEFEALLARTHEKGMKVIIDFVPNHVARNYHSRFKPEGLEDFGLKDDATKGFSASNDYYYIPDQQFVVPGKPGKNDPLSDLRDLKFAEFPAKATGNNVFSKSPSENDWYETVKLNYGVDYANGEKNHFDPKPPVWLKMRDILLYWASKGIDGFRCDMAEMVPVEFWEWVIPEIKSKYPSLIFIGEAYNSAAYATYLNRGHFDYLYDKVGLYDGLKRLIRNESNANVKEISKVWQQETAGFGDRMLRFLENHDEERIASAGFAGDPLYSIPAMVVSATLSGGPVMLYFGQEVGEPGKGVEGFGGEDNRTTIFDYWGVPEHQKWMNNGAFDGTLLSKGQKSLRDFYIKLMRIATSSDAIKDGRIYEIPVSGNMNNRMYGYIRYTAKQRLLIIVNFDRAQTLEASISLPEEVVKIKASVPATELLTDKKLNISAGISIPVKVAPISAQIIEF
ncbi:alpha-amylase family protein [Pedobacter nyackensis]|uniref:Glycosidase n=1 Tax=Pedobacter nyackensis TaxID=475255 RepID=A0A1W2B548_9SPHI|nr:alpha-amylase family protein [Pedobacter nyackensis]SMC68046.1 Glycosidase [Pedobacter nyackensis]